MSSILLAEDSSTHAALIRSILESGGHQVECVENGRLAFETLSQRQPDLVVTDLRMPEMNGMELVQAVAEQYPKLPSVVVTARGSESLAVDALALGAANFVPKNSLSKLLCRVVGQTIRMAASDRVFDGSGQKSTCPEYTLQLSNNLTSIEPVVHFVVQSLASAGHMNTTQRVRLGTAVHSALLNAICFGNLEIRDDETLLSRWLGNEETGIQEMAERTASKEYAGQTVELKFSVGTDDTRIQVSQSGRGRVTRMTPAPGTPESFELEQCRGLMLLTSFMDDVIFRSGNCEVVMVKRHTHSPALPAG
ncbi:ATP-binding response regulator [Rubripirellula reticaptiva]|uniref:Luminescence regulatory protein LuxO n=1 Tax=Rubripirellula reticaptiva TaxID=2528013 RepID=A0A5C6FD28_9BACT|nr:response regulator [Rubripirellula reticaptiva]TWU57976.1 Luminescence regulatory protein LuxO [Rubripirellula reticaptiva]